MANNYYTAYLLINLLNRAFLNKLRDGSNAILGSRLFQIDIELTETELSLRARRSTENCSFSVTKFSV
jgi:hypothetical protein